MWGSERSPGEGNGNPLHYSCLENPMEGQAITLTHIKSSKTVQVVLEEVL